MGRGNVSPSATGRWPSGHLAHVGIRVIDVLLQIGERRWMANLAEHSGDFIAQIACVVIEQRDMAATASTTRNFPKPRATMSVTC